VPHPAVHDAVQPSTLYRCIKSANDEYEILGSWLVLFKTIS